MASNHKPNTHRVKTQPLAALGSAVSLLMATAPAAQGGGAGPLRIGWAATDLTPDEPTHIAGYAYLRVSEGVADPITASVLVLESDGHGDAGDMLILVGIDLARAETVLCERVREIVGAARPEIDDANPAMREQPRWYQNISGVYWRLARAARVVRMHATQDENPAIAVNLHAIRIGDLAIVTHPVALYLDFGIQIKARSRAIQTLTVQTADGHFRYLPTERSLAGSAYGAVPESLYFGPQGGLELVEQTLALIEALWETNPYHAP